MSLISFFKKKRIVEKQEERKESFETIKDENIKNENYFCCPKCRQRILISLNPNNFSLSYICQKNHKESNIKYNNFYNENYIYKQLDFLCQQCKQKLNYNNILSCNICHIQLCSKCILKHINEYSHTNFGIINNSLNKCSKHNIDISLYCKTCKNNLCAFCMQKGENKNEHNEHDIINFSDLIPDEKKMENNSNKLDDKIKKNISIIDKLNDWKKDILSLVDDIMENLNCEIMIYKMIIKNFNWKFLDYINYLNYNEVLSNYEKNNSKLENFMNSKSLKEETNILNDYLFEKFEINEEVKKENNTFSIINENDNNGKEINNADEKQKIKDINDIFENYNNEVNLNIYEILNNGNALLCGNKNIYSCSLDNNELKKIYEFKDKENDKNEFINLLKNDNDNDNNIIFKNIIKLKKSLSNKYNNYNILLWKIENDLKKDNILNLINNKKKEDEENENKNHRIKEEKNENKKNEESKKCDNQSINNYGNNSERNNLNQPNNNNIDNNNESNGSLLINDTNNYKNNSNININNIFKNSTYDSNNIFNNNYNSTSNNFRNKEDDDDEEEEEEEEEKEEEDEEKEEEEEEDEYVYISSTGTKYHGYPTCGRMSSSTEVSIKRAEAMGLEPCRKCYY